MESLSCYNKKIDFSFDYDNQRICVSDYIFTFNAHKSTTKIYDLRGFEGIYYVDQLGNNIHLQNSNTILLLFIKKMLKDNEQLESKVDELEHALNYYKLFDK